MASIYAMHKESARDAYVALGLPAEPESGVMRVRWNFAQTIAHNIGNN